jgi:ATP/maltotriose-dependent transcriptional regulator MalT/DNA-binding SARP family transcriptional activator
MDALYGALDSRLILVVAGAGYGKTGLLAQFAKTEGFTFSWLTLDDREQDLRVFGEALVASLARCFPGFGQQTMQLLTSAGSIEQNTGLLVRTLTREISAHLTQPLCIVIDDFHLVETSVPVIQFIDRLVIELPDDAHLIIASRSLPSLQLGVLIAQQQVAALGQSALRLDQAETRQLIAALNNVEEKEVAEADAVKAFSETEGWLVGLLMTTHISQLREAQVGLSMPRAVDLLSDYLLVRVLQSLPQELQEFLYRTSILDNISLPFCKDVGWTDVDERIAEVERRNLFLQPQSAGGEEVTYRYHPLFREFLMQRLREDDPLRHTQLQRDVGAAYERSGNVEPAMRHFLLGGWSSDAMRLMELHAQTFLQQGRYRTLLDWLTRLDTLTPGIWHDRHVLWQCKILAHINLGHDGEAMTALDRLDELYLLVGDLGRRDGLNMRRGLLLVRSNHYEKALACANIVINSAYPQPTWAQVEARRIAAVSLLMSGRLSEALETITHAERLALSLGSVTQEYLARVKLTRSLILDELGETSASLRAVSEALALAEESKDGPLLAESLVMMAEWLLYSDEKETLIKTVKRGLEYADATGNQPVRIFGMRVLAMAQMATGESENALKTGAAGLALARQNIASADKETLFQFLISQCQLMCRYALQQQTPEERERILRQALGLAREAVTIAEASRSPRLCLWAYTRLGAVQAAQGDHDLAQVAFKSAEQVCGEFKDNACGQLYLWQLLSTWQAAGSKLDCENLTRTLVAISTLMAQRNQQFFAKMEGEWAWQTYQELSTAPDLMKLIVARRTNGHEGKLQIPAESSGQRTFQQIKLVQHDLRICAFGRGRVWRGNELITTSQWGWSIPRELFFMILTTQQATRAQIGTVFWPDAGTSTVQSSFHNAKFAISKALGKQAMTYANGVYSLSADLDYLYDVKTFDELIEQASHSDMPSALDKLVDATSLYEDDFLIDFSNDWTAAPRAALLEKFTNACLQAARIATHLNQPAQVINLLERACQHDNTNEELARALMTAQWQSGSRRPAIAAYERLVAALARELQISPSPETNSLLALIKARNWFDQGKPMMTG